MEREVGDDHPEHGVAEELEPLVGDRFGVLGAVRAVDQRPLEVHGIAEGPARSRPRSRMSASAVHAYRPGFPEADHDVVDRVADRVQVAEVLVVDAEADGALAQLLLERLDQLDQRERVGVEVVGEAGVERDPVLVDLEDLGQPLADQAQHLVGADRRPFDVGLSRHRR